MSDPLGAADTRAGFGQSGPFAGPSLAHRTATAFRVALGIFIFFLILEFVTSLELVPPIYLPRASTVMRRMVELALTGIAAHSVRPLRFAIYLALGFALLSLLFIVYALVSFLFVQHTVAGWSSLIAIIAILGAAQLLVLGIIGEYVGRILRETRRRPSYIVAEREGERANVQTPAAPAA